MNGRGWILLLVACAGDKPEGDGSDTGLSGGDADADADADTDSDADTDLDVNGLWDGVCALVAAKTTPYDFGPPDRLDVLLDLQQAGERVDGTAIWTSTSYDPKGSSDMYVLNLWVDGTLVGSDLTLAFVVDDTTKTRNFPAQLRATVGSDDMSGDVVVYPKGTYGYQPIDWSCDFTRP